MRWFSKKKQTEVKKRGAEYIPYTPPPAQEPSGPPREENKPLPVPGPDRSRFRIFLCASVFMVFWIILWGRAWYLQVIAAPVLAHRASEQYEFTEQVHGRRGMILDRNGQVVAQSVEVYSIYASPAKITDKLACANAVAPILGLDAQKLYERLQSPKSFVWLKRKIADSQAQQIAALKLQGIGLKTEYSRFYPFKHMAGQLIGFVNTDGKGLEGLEWSLDRRLTSPKVSQVVRRDAKGHRMTLSDQDTTFVQGENITLTLDMNMQYIAEEAISKAVKEFDARWGGALVVDVKSGDIMAWAQYPFFNPNSYSEYGTIIYRNRLAQDALEPGSTFKPLVMAIALQDKKVSPDTLINCEGGKWTNKDFTIRDTSIRGTIPASRVLRYSSNIGMAKIGLSIGTKRYYQSLKNLGFGQRTALPVAESRGILHAPRDWSLIDTMAISFGQSISVTALQMAQAYLTLLNEGVYKPLRILKEEVETSPRPRAFSAKTAHQVMDMMHDVVEAKDGTGRRAQIEGMDVAGKTGTAQKADRRARTYGSKRLASFVGFLPAKDPEFLILVMVDEPTRNQFGGIVSAPVFSEIGAKVMTYTGKMRAPRHDAFEEEKIAAEEEKTGPPLRKYKLASLPVPWETETRPKIVIQKKKNDEMDLPGKLATKSQKVPDVKGKTLRNAVELYARAGVVPELIGHGNLVVRQLPAAGSAWPKDEKKGNYVLWLSEK